MRTRGQIKKRMDEEQGVLDILRAAGIQLSRSIEEDRIVELHLDFTLCLDLTRLPPEIGRLVKLRVLRISGIALTSLPAEIGTLLELRELRLDDCIYLTRLPSEIGKLVELVVLRLRGCSALTSLPSEIGTCVKLQKLFIESFALTSLPSEIGKLIHLHRLSLSGCIRLTSLPSEMGKLKQLEDLNMSCCTSLTVTSGLSSCLAGVAQLRLDGMRPITVFDVLNGIQSKGSLRSLVVCDVVWDRSSTFLRDLGKLIQSFPNLRNIRGHIIETIIPEVELEHLLDINNHGRCFVSGVDSVPDPVARLPLKRRKNNNYQIPLSLWPTVLERLEVRDLLFTKRFPDGLLSRVDTHQTPPPSLMRAVLERMKRNNKRTFKYRGRVWPHARRLHLARRVNVIYYLLRNGPALATRTHFTVPPSARR